MKKHIYWLISIILIIITVCSFLLTILKVLPSIVLLEIFLCVLILFIANLSSGITYGVLRKNKVRSLVGFVLLNVSCIALLIYYVIIGALIM